MKKFSRAGFTLLELLTVMAIIIVLAGMILGGVGYAQKRAAMDRARAEIAALSVAIESYKVDNGAYPATPDDPPATEGGTPVKKGSNVLVPVNVANGRGTYPGTTGPYIDSGVALLADLEGRSTGSDTRPRYFEPKPDMLGTSARYLIDPFGNAYGYSTRGTFNPTFDLWSTAGATTDPTNPAPSATSPAYTTWITNW